MKLAFINGKGGCGKTTSIFHIAGVLSRSDEKVLVIDFDKQRNSTDTLLMNALERPKETVYDALCGSPLENAVSKALFQSRGNATPKYYGVDCMASDMRLEDEAALSQIDSERFGIAMDAFIRERGYSWVLVDMPPSSKTLNDICFSHVVDFLIVPFSSDVFSVSGYGDIMDTVQRARNPNARLNIIGVYLARYMPNCAVDRYIRQQLLKYDTFIDIQIPLAADIREAVMFGRPISFYRERVMHSWLSEDGMEKLKNDGSFVTVVKTQNTDAKKHLVKHVQPSIHAYEKLVAHIQKSVSVLLYGEE